ncbi:MAG: hypothetical protein WCW87_02725 [Candidatus Paceibacterota bacterium]
MLTTNLTIIICSQKCIRLEELEDQFKSELQKITIDDDYLKIALDYLHDKQGDFNNEETTLRKSLQASYDTCQTSLEES